MKVSMKQLDLILGKLKYGLLGFSDDRDLEIEISFEKEDPGSGVMTDCVRFTALKPLKEDEPNTETKMSIEVYPANEKIDPRGIKTENFKVLKKY